MPDTFIELNWLHGYNNILRNSRGQGKLFEWYILKACSNTSHLFRTYWGKLSQDVKSHSFGSEAWSAYHEHAVARRINEMIKSSLQSSELSFL